MHTHPMGGFPEEKIDEFNKAFQKVIEIFEFKFSANNYEDLKRDPKAYGFTESKRGMNFILKNEANYGLKQVVIMDATLYSDGKVRVEHQSIYKRDLDLINKLMKED